MRINFVEKATGLTQKAIRLYESKGLISVTREENGYRNYSESDVVALKKIKLLRSVGISIADIKLYLFGVLDIGELIDKRKKQILKESGMHSENYRVLDGIAKDRNFYELTLDGIFTENEDISDEDHGDLAVGIDIGTTTVSAVLFDLDNKKQLEAYSVFHNSTICSDGMVEQSVALIMEKAEKLLHHIVKSYSGIVSIGVSGQMHGIVYINEDGEPVSNLINWQDKRADKPLPSGKTTVEHIKDVTRENIATGYGIASHYYNLQNGLVPENARGFCSIMDLFAMRICGKRSAVSHPTVAASFGFFDIVGGKFMTEKLGLLGIDESFLPRVSTDGEMLGEYLNIPVSPALGDNQASFLGSVGCDEDSLLINIGTGAQVCAIGSYREPCEDIEIRPFICGKYLICGSSLCGGSGYGMLESFFRSYAHALGLEYTSQYKTINDIAVEAYNNGEMGLKVDASFCGKRSDPASRGAIYNIDLHSFTPSALVIGVLRGICEELYGMYRLFSEEKKCAIASGGAVRKNPVLQKLLSDRFGMAVAVSNIVEEAAIGAALFSALSFGKIKSADNVSDLLNT